MNDFSVGQNFRSAFLGQKRRRKSEGVPKWKVLGALFEYFGAVFSNTYLFFAKIGRKCAVFDSFEKDTRVFALRGELEIPYRKIRTYDDFP